MSTTIFEAPPYNPERDRRRRLVVITIIIAALLLAVIGYRYRNWPSERLVARFFDALQHKQYDVAYGIWMHDPDWKQHAERYPKYPFNEFYQDWGPGGEWGLINSFKVDGSDDPKGGSGVVVVVTVNDRAEKARLWVEKSDKTLTYSPY
jgi:hypothetical protein